MAALAASVLAGLLTGLESWVQSGVMPERMRKQFELLGIEYKPRNGTPLS